MKRRHIIGWILVVVLSVQILLILHIAWKGTVAPIVYFSQMVKDTLIYYHEIHNRWPSNLEEMIENNHIRYDENGTILVKLEEQKKYRMSHENNGWYRCNRFKTFDINFSVDFNKITIRDGKLYDNNGKRLFLIYGPFHIFTPYDNYSMELYKEYKE
jgi:hypothetical protein